MGPTFPSLALIKRELLTSLRQRRTYMLMLACTTIVFFTFIFFLVAVDFEPRQLSMAARAAFTGLVWLWGIVAVLFLPPLSAVSICVEKQQGSYDMLWCTLVRPWGVIAAKMANVLVIFLCVVFACLPVVGVLFFFVGVDWQEFLFTFSLVCFVAAGCTAGGLLCSAFFYRTLPALVSSYILAMFYIGLPQLMLLILGAEVFNLERHWRWIYDMAEATFSLWCPFAALAVLTDTGRLPNMSFAFVALYHLVCILVLSCLTRRIVLRAPRPMRVDSKEVIDDTEVLRVRRRTFPFYLIDPQRRRKAIPDGRNPMYAKEVYCGLLARPTLRIRTFYVCLLLAFPVGLFGAVENWHVVVEPAYITFWVLSFPLVILAPIVMAHALPKEHELGNMDMLRASLLSPAQILFGKLFSGALALFPMLLGALSGLLIMFIPMAWSDLSGFLLGSSAGLLSLMLSVAWALVICLFISVFCRRTITALLSCYLAGLFAFAGLPLLLIVLSESLRNIRVDTTTQWGPWLFVLREHLSQQKVEPFVTGLSPLIAPGYILDHRWEVDGALFAYWSRHTLGILFLMLFFLGFAIRTFRRRMVRW